jgi:hypothetical protein
MKFAARASPRDARAPSCGGCVRASAEVATCYSAPPRIKPKCLASRESCRFQSAVTSIGLLNIPRDSEPRCFNCQLKASRATTQHPTARRSALFVESDCASRQHSTSKSRPAEATGALEIPVLFLRRVFLPGGSFNARHPTRAPAPQPFPWPRASALSSYRPVTASGSPRRNIRRVQRAASSPPFSVCDTPSHSLPIPDAVETGTAEGGARCHQARAWSSGRSCGCPGELLPLSRTST